MYEEIVIVLKSVQILFQCSSSMLIFRKMKENTQGCNFPIFRDFFKLRSHIFIKA